MNLALLTRNGPVNLFHLNRVEEWPLINTRTTFEADLDALVQLFDQYRNFYEQSSDPDAARAF